MARYYYIVLFVLGLLTGLLIQLPVLWRENKCYRNRLYHWQLPDASSRPYRSSWPFAGLRAHSSRTINLNLGICQPASHTHQSSITQQHLRFYYYTLPEEHVARLRGMCGESHGVLRVNISESWPTGLYVARNHSTTVRNECTYGQLYATDQYAAVPMWRQQLIGSPLRVHDVQNADIVIVDLADDICMSVDSLYLANTSEVAKAAMGFVLKHLNATGKPHVVPLSRTEDRYWYPWYDGGFLRASGAENLTWISQEITDVPSIGIKYPGRAPAGGINDTSHYNVVAIPYASTLHMYTHDKYFMHLDDLRHKKTRRHGASAGTSKHNLPCHVSRKTLLAAGSYTARFPARKELKRQCLAAGPDRCQHMEVGLDNLTTLLPAMHDMYSRAWFCLMPAGDTHSRRSFVDCLLQDAIPVVFSNWTRDTAPYADVIDPSQYVVSLPELDSSLHHLGLPAAEQPVGFQVKLDAFDVLSYLEQKYPRQARLQMLHNIFQIKHLYQMMMDPVHELVRFDQLYSVHCLDDQFTAGLKAVLRNLCRRNHLPQKRCGGDPTYSTSILVKTQESA